MRVVLDTSILVAAVIGKRLGAIVDHLRQNRFRLVYSEAVLREYVEVIHRPKFAFPQERIETILNYIALHGDIVEPDVRLGLVSSDPSDNMFLEAAVAGRAGLIVSGDAHLLGLKRLGEIEIINGREFLDRLGSGAPGER